MKIIPLKIPDVLVIEPNVFGDARGFFYEIFNEAAFERETGVHVHFVQQNASRSQKNVVRGLHYQIRQTQGKLVRVLDGEIYDVVVDIRKSSRTFGQWLGRKLTAESLHSIWIPPGLAHGFTVLSDSADISYAMTDYYAPQHERRMLWNDPAIGIEWPLQGTPIVSEADAKGMLFRESELFD